MYTSIQSKTAVAPFTHTDNNNNIHRDDRGTKLKDRMCYIQLFQLKGYNFYLQHVFTTDVPLRNCSFVEQSRNQ